MDTSLLWKLPSSRMNLNTANCPAVCHGIQVTSIGCAGGLGIVVLGCAVVWADQSIAGLTRMQVAFETSKYSFRANCRNGIFRAPRHTTQCRCRHCASATKHINGRSELHSMQLTREAVGLKLSILLMSQLVRQTHSCSVSRF